MSDRVVLHGDALNELLRSPNGDVAKELTRRVIRVESAAIRDCPVDTGRLRSSLTHEIATDTDGLVGRVGTDVEYAPYVEADQPFLVPALGAAQ